MTAFQSNREFIVLTCYDCGIDWAMPEYFVAKRREDHRTFFCPSGHSQHFPAENPAERLKRLLAIANQQISRAEDERNEAIRAKLRAEAAAKRIEKRAKAGVCPCCHRTVSQLARHMATKHPD